MKIHSIEAIAIEIQLKRNFGGSTYSVLKRSTVVTRMRTDEGLASEVYNGDNREHGRDIVRLIHEQLAPRVKGMDILEVERAWQAMFDLTHTNGDRKTLLEAIACVDCALWDLVGKARGRSARQLLAGVPHGTYVECFADPERDPIWQTMWANRPAVKDGMMEVGTEPGFGIELDWKMVGRYRVA